MASSNLLIVAGSEGYAIDMGLLASRFTRVALVRWTSPGFEGSLIELYSMRQARVSRVAKLRIPLRTRRSYQWYASRLPLFVINTCLMLLLAIRAKSTMRSNTAGVSALGIGWGGGLVALLMKKFRLIDSFAYYRVDWFVGRPEKPYDFLTVNVFFRSLDRIISRASGYVWNITEAVRLAAKRTHHFTNGKESVVTPLLGGSLTQIANHNGGDHYVVYCGEVKPGCGLPLILGAIRTLQSQNKAVKLKVLGRARTDYLTALHYQYSDVFGSGACQYLGGFDLGNESDRERINHIIADADAGLAIFPDGYMNTSNYVIPNRLLLYLSNNTPVLVNGDSAIADLLSTAGVAVPTIPQAESIAKSLIPFCESDEYRTRLRSNIASFMTSFGTSEQSERAIRELTKGRR